LEHAHWRSTKKLVNLSESQFVDCDTKTNGGCNGGDVQLAYEYAQFNAIELLANYPYVAKDMPCKTAMHSQGKVNVSTYMNVEVNSTQ